MRLLTFFQAKDLIFEETRAASRGLAYLARFISVAT
jgi:hypothetical protein